MIRKRVILGSVLILIFGLSAYQNSSLRKYPWPDLPHFPSLPRQFEMPTLGGASLGRFLFYDPILSADSSLSCGSCHRQEAAFSDSPRRFSPGIGGQERPRNTMPLFNLSWYPAFFWDGRAANLNMQALHPVRDSLEMGLSWQEAEKRIRRSSFYRRKFREVYGEVPIDSLLIADALGQFERTLLSYNSKYDRVLRGEDTFSREEYRGYVLMNDQSMADCLHCHTTDADALGTTALFSNNGLDVLNSAGMFADEGKAAHSGESKDRGAFKIPSLRNVAVTSPYMHDGRFETLREVLDFYSEGVQWSAHIDPKMQFAQRGGVRLSEDEKAAIIAFLHTLTDSTFLTNPEFANPHFQISE